MNSRQKILSVLSHIKRESEINPDPQWVHFHFNTSVIGGGILMDDEEKRILLKLEKGGLIELHLPDGETDEEESMLSTFTPSEFMMGHDFIYIKILPAFYSKYYLYNLTSFGGNMWNAVNPFWVTWQMLRCAGLLVEWLWAKSKIATAVIGTLSAVLVFDWSLAWKNLSLIIKFVKSIM